MPQHKSWKHAFLLLFAAGACAPVETAAIPAANSRAPYTPKPAETTPPPKPTACDDPFEGDHRNFPLAYWEGRTDFCLHSIPYSEIFSGNPRPDGIPAIDSPVFESVAQADTWLGEDWPVMFFEWNGEARAYPLAILIWHEIVNDVVGGEAVALTFCPLCNATLAFRSTLPDGRVLDFGTTGNLRNSDLVMYDRQTYSWWQQFTGEAIVGALTGARLEVLPSQIVAWRDFKSAHPDGDVLSRQTGHAREYGRNPYPGYDSINGSPFFPVEIGDERLAPMERVLAFEIDGIYSAYPFSGLRQVRAVNDEVAGEPVVVFWKAGTESTFGSNGVDTGSAGVFLRTLNGRVLRFEPDGDGFTDAETGSAWNILGEAVGGTLRGSALTRINAGEHFWFAWAAFSPEIRVWGGE